jgi:SAM-dependent methyltransferase
MKEAYGFLQLVGPRVLDVGCGPAYDLFHLALEYGASGVGVEPDPDSIKYLEGV